MTRRKFIGIVGGAITLWPLLGIARQRKVPTIGISRSHMP